MFRGRHKIYSKVPDNPSNINWENLEKGAMNKCSKILMSFCVIILILCLAMVINLMLQSFNTNYKKTNDFNEKNCLEEIKETDMSALYEKHKEYANNFDLSESEEEKLKADNYFHINNCYCSQYNYFDILKDQATKYVFCQKILITFLTTVVVSVVTGIFISVINFVLVIIISKLIMWIPFKSLSTQIAMQILFITISLFINTMVNLTRWFSSSFTVNISSTLSRKST